MSQIASRSDASEDPHLEREHRHTCAGCHPYNTLPSVLQKGLGFEEDGVLGFLRDVVDSHRRSVRLGLGAVAACACAARTMDNAHV